MSDQGEDRDWRSKLAAKPTVPVTWAELTDVRDWLSAQKRSVKDLRRYNRYMALAISSIIKTEGKSSAEIVADYESESKRQPRIWDQEKRPPDFPAELWKDPNNGPNKPRQKELIEIVETMSNYFKKKFRDAVNPLREDGPDASLVRDAPLAMGDSGFVSGFASSSQTNSHPTGHDPASSPPTGITKESDRLVVFSRSNPVYSRSNTNRPGPTTQDNMSSRSPSPNYLPNDIEVPPLIPQDIANTEEVGHEAMDNRSSSPSQTSSNTEGEDEAMESGSRPQSPNQQFDGAVSSLGLREDGEDPSLVKDAPVLNSCFNFGFPSGSQTDHASHNPHSTHSTGTTNESVVVFRRQLATNQPRAETKPSSTAGLSSTPSLSPTPRPSSTAIPPPTAEPPPPAGLSSLDYKAFLLHDKDPMWSSTSDHSRRNANRPRCRPAATTTKYNFPSPISQDIADIEVDNRSSSPSQFLIPLDALHTPSSSTEEEAMDSGPRPQSPKLQIPSLISQARADIEVEHEVMDNRSSSPSQFLISLDDLKTPSSRTEEEAMDSGSRPQSPKLQIPVMVEEMAEDSHSGSEVTY